MNMKQSIPRRIFLICNLIFLVIVSLACFLPFVNLLAISFSDKIAVVADKVTFYPIGFTTAAYKFIMRNATFLSAVVISIERTVLGVVLNVILIVLVAYPLSKTKEAFRARGFFSWFFVVTILFSGGLMPTYMIVRSTGIMDSIWSLILPGALPVFSMLVVMNYMRSLPRELEEAAYIDGANHIQTLLRVTLPVCTPTIATVTMFAFVGHWNSWFDGMIYMNQTSHYPLQTYLQTVVVNPEQFFRNAATFDTSKIISWLSVINARTSTAAQLFLAIVPILCVYPFLQKYFVTGLVMGSVKG
jgi:putative aldouronate transport system permease protein